MRSLTSFAAVASSLIVPIALGLSLFVVFCGLVDSRVIDDNLVDRYLMGHWVNRTSTALFLIGAAGLFLAAKDVLGQFASERRIRFGHKPGNDDEVTDQSLSAKLQAELIAMPRRLHDTYLFQRFKNILEHIGRNGASESTENELRHLSDGDAERKHLRYSFVRILIWAIPLLGFLGTVLGISDALGKLSAGGNTDDVPTMIAGLQGSLYVAFDTTAQALVMSIALMFVLYMVDRFEAQLLKLVDHRAVETISRYFEFVTPGNEAASQVSRLGRRMLAATRSAVREHTEIWKETISAAENAWATTQKTVHEDLRSQLGRELTDALTKFADQLGMTISGNMQTVNDRFDTGLQHLASGLNQTVTTIGCSFQEQVQMLQTVLAENATTISAASDQASKQTKAIGEILARLDNVASLQAAVNRSLDALTATSRMDHAITELVQAVESLRRDLATGVRTEMQSPRRVRADEAVPIRLYEGSRRAA